jgi:hypothetical protein
MYFDSEGESDAEPGTPRWSDSEDEESVSSSNSKTASSSASATHKELYSLETLTSVYDYLNPMVKKTQTLLLLGCSAKYASAPEQHRSSWSKLKHEPDLFKTYTLKGDLEVVNPHVPAHVLHLKKLDVPAIYSKIKLCKGDSAAVVAALQNLAESGSMWRTKRQSNLKEAERETAPQFTVNTYAKGCAVVDVLYTASSKSYAVLLDDDADDTIDTAVNVFDMSVLKKDKHGVRAIFDVDLMKILFSSGANKVVLVNLSGIVDEDEEEKDMKKMPPVFTDQSEELTEIPSSPAMSSSENNDNENESVQVDTMDTQGDEPMSQLVIDESGSGSINSNNGSINSNNGSTNNEDEAGTAMETGSRKSTPLNSPGSSRSASPARSSPPGSRNSTPLNSPGSSRSSSPVPMEDEEPEPEINVEEIATTPETEVKPVEQGGTNAKGSRKKQQVRKHINLTLKAKQPVTTK